MNVYLSDGLRDQVPGDLIGRWVLRSDLAPVPRTVEIVFNDRDDLFERVGAGKSLWTGRETLEYEVVSAKRERLTAAEQDGNQLGAIRVTALLKACAGIAYLRDRAVVLERATLGEAYRSCGAKIAIGDDFHVERFSCLRGEVPSYAIAQALQEEGAALVLRDGRVAAKRLTELVAQAPVATIGQSDSTNAGDSPFVERHSIPAFISADDSGAVVAGDMAQARSIRYLPYTAERGLMNASKVLVVRRVADSDLAQHIAAGDVVDVDGERMVVITAAHEMKAKDAVTESGSRFWLGGLSQ